MVGYLIVNWEVWASLGTGLGVGGLIIALGRYTRFFKRRAASMPGQEDLPWEDLLELLKSQDEEAVAGLSSTQLLEYLMAQIPGSTDESSSGTWTSPNTERRRGRRRWLNPVEVAVFSPFHDQPLHGVVINRSVGGLAILCDVNFEPDTVLRVRAVEAPPETGFVDLCVRHSREVSRLWLIGCQYKNDVPWNVKVWFG